MNETDEMAIAVVTFAFIGSFLLVSLVLYIFYAIGVQKIAKRQGVKSPWLAWIPIISSFLFVHLSENTVHKPLRGSMLLLYGLSIVAGFFGGFFGSPVIGVAGIILTLYAFYFLARRYSNNFIVHFVAASLTLGGSMSISVFIFRNNEDLLSSENQAEENDVETPYT